MLNPTIIRENIIFLRQQHNITQQELAARVNVTHQAVSKWENGSSIPDLQTLMTLSRLFNVTLDELLTEVLSERRPAPQADAPADEPVAEQPAAPVEPITPVEPVAPVAPVELVTPAAPVAPVNASTAEQPAAEQPNAPVDQPAAAPIDINVLVKMAPLMGRSELGRTVLSTLTDKASADSIDISALTRLAPFLDRAAMSQLADKLCADNIDPSKLSAIAPFCDSATLVKLLDKADGGKLNLSLLSSIAPFLDRAAMDNLLERLDPAQIDAHALSGIAPFASHDALGRFAEKVCADHIDFSTLTALAPFMSKSSIDSLLNRLDPAQINGRALAGLAPFASRDALTALVEKACADHIDMDTLIPLAPFIDRATVDALADKAFAEAPTVDTVAALAPFLSREKLAELTAKLGDLSLNDLVKLAPHLARGAMSSLLQKLVPGRFHVTVNNNDGNDDAPSGIRDAIDDGNWGYIEDHIADMTPAEARDAALAAAEDGYLDFIPALSLDQHALDQVARLAMENGDIDDIFEFLPWKRLSPDAQNAAIDAALCGGSGDELIEHRRELTAEQLARVALSLAENGDFDELAGVFFDLPDDARARILDLAVDENDLDFLSGHFDRLAPADQERLALRMAENTDFDALQPLLPHLNGKALSRVVNMALDANELDFVAPSVRRLAPADQEKIAVRWAEEEEWSELTRHVDLTTLGRSALRRLIDLADEQEETAVARRLRALLDQADEQPQAAPPIAADELLSRARTGDFAPLAAALPALNGAQWDELVRLAIVYDAFDALAPHAAEIPPQPYETLCYALARQHDMKHLSVFFPNPSANPALAQRLNRVLENND